jgi:hypothetical protein
MLSLEAGEYKDSTPAKKLKPGQHESEAPTVFTYSLYYVYYD